MVDQKHKISLVKQCRTLEISRSGVYYERKPEKKENQELKRIIDRLHLERPYLGIRRMTDQLKALGWKVNRKRVQRLMRAMRIEAIYPKPNLSKVNKQHKIYPYLLRGLKIDEAKSGMGDGYHLYSNGEGFRVFNSNHGLVQPQDTVVEVVKYVGLKFLHRSFGRSVIPPWKA